MKNKQTVNFTIACENLTVKELSDRLDFMASLLRTVLLMKGEQDIIIDPMWLPESMRLSCNVRHEFFAEDKSDYKLSCGMYAASEYERGKNYTLLMNQALMKEMLKGGTLGEILTRYKKGMD